jgi:uncharacterized radical SAM superfamily Fe-S cluster-containing enzyme
MSRCRAWNVLGGAYTDSASALQTACQGDCDMGETTDYVHPFDDAIRVLFADAVRITLRQPSMAGFFVRMRRAQRLAERRRAVSARQGVHVPPFMIISVTGRCNLSCAGCYAQAQGRQEEAEMTQSQLLDEQLVQRARRQRNRSSSSVSRGTPQTRTRAAARGSPAARRRLSPGCALPVSFSARR